MAWVLFCSLAGELRNLQSDPIKSVSSWTSRSISKSSSGVGLARCDQSPLPLSLQVKFVTLPCQHGDSLSSIRDAVLQPVIAGPKIFF
jgi:hypothetical protein